MTLTFWFSIAGMATGASASQLEASCIKSCDTIFVTISLRNLPPAVEKAILEVSKREGISLNKAAHRLLEGALHTPSVNHDFDEFRGAWSASQADRFDAALAEMRRVDPADWVLER